MSGREVPFWEEDSWSGYAKWFMRFTDIPGEEWCVARFANGPFPPEQLFFHTCEPFTQESLQHAASGACKSCGANIPMEYLRKATFIDRLYNV